MLRRLCTHGAKASTISRMMGRRMLSLTADQQERAFARATEIRAKHHELHFPEKRYLTPVPVESPFAIFISETHFPDC